MWIIEMEKVLCWLCKNDNKNIHENKEILLNIIYYSLFLLQVPIDFLKSILLQIIIALGEMIYFQN